ncbi:Activator of Hsp90 ATPase homolog 1-like protein [Cellulomonas fimi]|nr:Activator of Hsp90 ATPase homolog 1-like protein [Cellulomonas fimi]
MQLAAPGPVDRVWQALTDGRHTVSWLGRLNVERVVEGGHFDLWHDEDVSSRHTVVQWHPRRLLALTWDFPEEHSSRVSFGLAETSASTAMLTVHHESVDDAVSYAAGWHRHLQFLEAHLRGRDLPLGEFWTGYDDLVGLYGADQFSSDARPT